MWFHYKMRLRFNKYASRTAYERLKNAIRENADLEIYASTGELLLWVLTTDEWHKIHGASDYEQKRDRNTNGIIMSGLRHAYNMMKHNMGFIQIHQKEGGLRTPFTLPMTLTEVKVIWMPAGEVLNGKHPNQKNNYINHIEGEEVLETFTRVLTFLNQESRKYLIED